MQSVYNLSDGAGLALTSAKYYTPSGRCIQRDYKDVLEYLSPEDEEGDGEETGPARDAASTQKKESFRTESGRIVYGGGGITPDVFVKAPTLSRFAATLYARGLFFEFAVDYRAKHSAVPRDFQMTPAVREEFFKFVDAKPGLPFEGKTKASYEAEADPSISRPRHPRGAAHGGVRARSRLPREHGGRRPAQEGPHAFPRRREARDGPPADAAGEELRPEGAGEAVDLTRNHHNRNAAA